MTINNHLITRTAICFVLTILCGTLFICVLPPRLAAPMSMFVLALIGVTLYSAGLSAREIILPVAIYCIIAIIIAYMGNDWVNNKAQIRISYLYFLYGFLTVVLFGGLWYAIKYPKYPKKIIQNRST